MSDSSPTLGSLPSLSKEKEKDDSSMEKKTVSQSGESVEKLDVESSSVTAKKFGYVWRKADLRLLPVVSMIYLLAFLDRTNLGNARIAGLQNDLHLTNYQYSVALTVTYVPYIVVELPSNLLINFVGPERLIPCMVVIWGLVTTLQGVVKSYAGLLVCRFFLGAMEGGIVPGLVLYLSGFYPRSKLQYRVSVFFSNAALSGAFSGLLAAGILNLNGKRHIAGWRWIFILEGAFTIFFGIVSFFVLPRSPAKTTFYTAEEKEYVLATLEEDGAIGDEDDKDSFSWSQVLAAFKVPHVWFLAVAYFFHGTLLYSMAYFAPTIVQALGYKGNHAQLMTVPPFAVAFVVAITISLISDKYHARGFTCIFCSVLLTIGMSMFIGSSKNHVRYASLFFTNAGIYTLAPALGVWSANNSAPYVRRATVLATGFMMVNCGGILSTWLALAPSPKPTTATKTLVSFAVGVFVCTVANYLWLRNENAKKAIIRSKMTKAEEKPGLGDRSAWFIYSL